MRKRHWFLLAFFVYNLNLRPIPAGDTTPAALLPFSILLDHSFNLDRFYPWYARQMEPYWFARHANGHYYSAYPVLLPLVITPAYAPVALVPGIRDWPVERTVLLARVLEKLAASIIAALSVAAFFALAERMAAHRAAAWLTVVYAFGSSTWSISSQALWQHGAGELAVILTLLFLWDGRAGLAGLWAGLSVAFRATNLMFLAISTVLVTRFGKVRRLLFAIPAAAGAAAVLTYNLAMFHRLSGGYQPPVFDGNILASLPAVLLSPSRGLFVFSPVFLLAGIGVYRWWRDGRGFARMIYGICLIFVVAHVLLVSRWHVWWGGFSYGPRLLTDVVPCLAILIIPALDLVRRKPVLKAAATGALAVSIFVQAVGVFCYPNGHWDAVPQPVDARPERVWNWRDNQIGRSLAAGPMLDPYRLAWRVLTGRGTGEGFRVW